MLILLPFKSSSICGLYDLRLLKGIMTGQKALKLTLISERERVHNLLDNPNKQCAAGFPQEKENMAKSSWRKKKKLKKDLKAQDKIASSENKCWPKPRLTANNKYLKHEETWASGWLTACIRGSQLQTHFCSLKVDDFGVNPWLKEGATFGADVVPGAGSSCALG